MQIRLNGCLAFLYYRVYSKGNLGGISTIVVGLQNQLQYFNVYSSDVYHLKMTKL